MGGVGVGERLGSGVLGVVKLGSRGLKSGS